MRAPRFYLWLSQYRLFARAASISRAGLFRTRRTHFRLTEYVRTERLESAVFRSLMRLAAPTLVLLALFVLAVAWIEGQLRALGFATVPPALSAAYTEVLIGVASMGTVLIGLYYTAIS